VIRTITTEGPIHKSKFSVVNPVQSSKIYDDDFFEIIRKE